MNNITVENPKLILYVFECKQNIEVLHDLIDNDEVFEMARVTLIWLSEERILEIDEGPDESKPRQTFVLPTFSDSELYRHLHSLGYTIWGPHVIKYCATNEVPLPDTPHDLFSMVFNDTIVSFAGFDDKQLEQESQRIELMGGQVATNFTMTTNILISKTCEPTQRFKIACAWKTPICDVKLIDEMLLNSSEHVSKYVNDTINEFALGLLSGCVISFGGIEPQQRKQLEPLINQHGGIYMENLDKDKCTHLISGQISSNKFKLASKWNLKIVTSSWVFESLECDVRLPEKFYYPRAFSENMLHATLG